MIVLPRKLRSFENIRISHGVRSAKMDKLTPPEQLNLESVNLAENWRQWQQRFDTFSLATGLSEKSDKVQSATLLHVAGPTALEVYNTFTWDEDGDLKYYRSSKTTANHARILLGNDTSLTHGTNKQVNL